MLGSLVLRDVTEDLRPIVRSLDGRVNVVLQVGQMVITDYPFSLSPLYNALSGYREGHPIDSLFREQAWSTSAMSASEVAGIPWTPLYRRVEAGG